MWKSQGKVRKFDEDWKVATVIDVNMKVVELVAARLNLFTVY